MQYTKETLIKENQSYHSQHGISDNDVIMANIYKYAVERSRLQEPQCGDILMIDDKVTHAHIESIEDNKLSVCDFAMTPFISCRFNDSRARISTNTSGGAWRGIDMDTCEDTHTKKSKAFCFFGGAGMCANGAVHFNAEVNVYKVK